MLQAILQIAQRSKNTGYRTLVRLKINDHSQRMGGLQVE
jgi:hypothetical protein